MSQQPYYTPPQPLEVPGSIAGLVGSYNLGRVLACYQVPRQTVGGIALILVGGFIALSTLCTGGILVLIFSRVSRSNGTSLIADRGTLFFILALAACVLGGGAMVWFGIRLLAGRPKRVYLCDEGIVLDEKQGVEPLRWDQVASVSRYWTRHARQQNANHSHREYYFTYHCHLICKDGQERSIEESSFKDGRILCDEIARQVTRRLLPQALAAYRADQMLNFGDLSVSKQGLSQDQGRSGIPWSAVESILLGGDQKTRDEMAILVPQGDESRRWYENKRMPNVAIFREIARVAGVKCKNTLQLPSPDLIDFLLG
ncbi:MAG: hypothetical protein H0U76_04915 [Ktedonobacteraceae bacterium]|nr:hypothetical protein [Ktedonobacteraceae bacterium]